MSAPDLGPSATLVRRRLSGVTFLVVLALLVWLTVLVYQKAFTRVVNVTLRTDHIGNQLTAQADVKLRGLLVGTVRGVHTHGDGATVELALDPGQARRIPANVVAQLVPKTLFGEKFVNLVVPAQPSAQHLRSGSVIPQDHSRTALETEKVLDDLLPVLQSLRPVELSTTLDALATALRGRGDALGGNLTTAGAYFAKVNPTLPTVGADLAGLAALTDEINQASPDVLRVLDNLAASSRNLQSERASLDAFLASSNGFATSARSFVADNEQRLVALAHDSRPSLALYARYSPMLPCWLAGLARYEPIVARTFGGGQPGLHITVEATTDNGGFRVGQEPAYRDARAPNCWKLPHPQVPEGNDKFDDGYQSSPSPSPAGPALDLTSLLLGPLNGRTTVGAR